MHRVSDIKKADINNISFSHCMIATQVNTTLTGQDQRAIEISLENRGVGASSGT